MALTAGFPCLLESRGFFGKISRPWKVLEMDLVLESPENFTGRFWRVLEFFLLGYDAGGRHSGVGADAEICAFSNNLFAISQ